MQKRIEGDEENKKNMETNNKRKKQNLHNNLLWGWHLSLFVIFNIFTSTSHLLPNQQMHRSGNVAQTLTTHPRSKKKKVRNKTIFFFVFLGKKEQLYSKRIFLCLQELSIETRRHSYLCTKFPSLQQIIRNEVSQFYI